MKLAIACDHLLERTYLTQIIDSLVMLFPEAEVFTLAHHQGQIGGATEQRKIHSSFLSNIVKKRDDLWKYSAVIPSAAKNLHIPCSFKVVIKVGDGLANLISHCEEAKVISLLINDHENWPKPKKLSEKLFRSMLKSKVEDSMEYIHQLWKSCESISDRNKESFLIRPPVKLEHYPFFGESQSNLVKEKYINVLCDTFENRDVIELEKLSHELKIKFQWLSSKQTIEGIETTSIVENPSLPMILANGLGLICGNSDLFYDLAVKNMAVGRPVFTHYKSSIGRILNGEGLITYENTMELRSLVANLEQSSLDKKIRGRAMAFSDIKFKSTVKRKIEALNP